MASSNGPALKTANTPEVQGDFADNAKAPADSPQIEPSFSMGVASEVALNQEREAALERHEFRWKIHRERIANQTEISPSLGPDGNTSRSVQNEYQHMRDRWEVQRDAILQDYEIQVTDHRANGNTLSDHFQSAEPTKQGREAELTDAFADAGKGPAKPTLPDPQPEPNPVTPEPDPVEPSQDVAVSSIETQETVTVTREFSCSAQVQTRAM